jgi:hypothetical protein
METMAVEDRVTEAAASLGEAFYETMLGVGESLEARGELPETAEEFARIVSYVVFDQMTGAVMAMNSKRRKAQ